MIAPEIVDEIRRLLAEGRLSQRKIARRTGVSRNTVGAIATGRRRDRKRRHPGRLEADDAPPAGPPQRCPGCGGMVWMPCRLCRTRARMSPRQPTPVPRWLRPVDQPLGLDLKGEYRARYQQVRARRAEAERALLQPAWQEEHDLEEEPDFDEVDFEHPVGDVGDTFDLADCFDESDYEQTDDWEDLRTVAPPE
ncbi:MAG: helix-turn-helix domain-containing protein [Pirellulales bacterium]|nr:helix-turn-helix domain-containing protein [Pirellulales bacterium]